MIATPFFSPSIPLIAAPPTPLTADGSLNLAAVEKQATQLAADGVSGVFIGGTTGESASLTLEERQQLAARWCEVLHRSSLRRIIHVGSNCLADACRLADQARKLQADGIAAVAPCYFRPTDTLLLVDCCAQIAAAAPELPFYYYEIPSITGIHLPTDRFLSEAMERIPSFGGLKYSNSDLPLLQRCVAIAAGRLELFFGSDEILLAALGFGATGAVGSTYNIAAPLYRRMLAAAANGDFETARAAQLQSVGLVDVLSRHGYLPSLKAVLTYRGIPMGPVRLPLRNLGAEQVTVLLKEIEAIGAW